MGSGWSEAQAPQSPPPSSSQVPAHNAVVLRSDDLNASNSIQCLSNQKNSKAVKERAAEIVKLPHGFESMVKDADSPVDRSSMDKLYDQLTAGIFLNKSTRKYWVEKKSNSNCLMLFPRALSITWAEDPKYWKWKPLEEASNTIEVAELLNVCWLEVNGKIKTTELSPGILYEALMVIMIKNPSYGWDVPVNLRVIQPAGIKLEGKQNLLERPKDKWIEIPLGDFIVNHDHTGEIHFSMFEFGGMWKKGLLLKGLVIRPKN